MPRIPLWVYFALPFYGMFSFLAFMNIKHDHEYHDYDQFEQILVAIFWPIVPFATLIVIGIGIIVLYKQAELDYTIMDDSINGRGLDTIQWLRLLTWDFE